MGQANAVLVSRLRPGVENNCVIFGKRDRPAVKWSNAQLRTLEVDQNADWAPTLFLQRPNHCSLRPELIMSGMAHIDAKKIGPGLKHRRRYVWTCRRRSESCNDFAPAQPPHVRLTKLGF